MTVEAQTLKWPILTFEKPREIRTHPKSPPKFQAIDETFLHGWRYVTKTSKNGEQTYHEIPLKGESKYSQFHLTSDFKRHKNFSIFIRL
jgi:hypothetical protein